MAEALSMMRDFITEVVDDKQGYEILMKTYAKHRKILRRHSTFINELIIENLLLIVKYIHPYSLK